MWERVKEIFHQVLKRPGEVREELLEAACGRDNDLRSEVEELLASHDEVRDDSLVSQSKNHDDPVARVFPVEGPGSVIGRYKPLEEIGEGGMGVVYLAQQEKPVRRKVALKIIKLGMDTKEVIARFEAERQALAIMDHTNIAKVFDAGTTDLGRPYFVMEYISGMPITDYCDQQRLNAAERLRLFIPVCYAIHHAHQKGIIHRDVKPNNVLVTVQDGKPVPKVIDFGVAKATNQRLTEKTVYTEQGVLIGTPVYMSPEQADMTGLTVDTTTDVYSLGALLYELLAGAPPFDAKSLRAAGFEAIHRMIREVEPPKPSNRFSGLGDEGTTVAEKRRTEPATLERQIRGELDWITMRAMEKDRSRRYQSASEFAADIERYLLDEPVEAGPPTRFYRFRKFARRNRGVVGLVAAAMLISTAFTVTMTVQTDRVTRERDRAQMETRRSRVGAEILQAVLFEDSRIDDRGPARSTLASRARETWEVNRRALAGDPAELALYAANLLYLSDWYIHLSDWNYASPEFQMLQEELEPEAYDLINQAIAERDTSILKTVDLVISRINQQGQRWDFKSEVEEKLYRDAIALRREVMSPGDPGLKQHLVRFAEYLESKGRLAMNEGRSSDAEPVFRELIEVRLEIDPPPTIWTFFPSLAKGLLGECLMRLNRYSEAEPLLLQYLEVHDTRDARLLVISLYESWDKPEKAVHFRKDLLVEAVREIGPIGTLEVRGMRGGSSGFLGGRSVWVFNDGLLKSEGRQGGGIRANRWAWTDDLNASDGISLREPPYVPNGRRKLLPLSPDEKAFNDAHQENPGLSTGLGTIEPIEQWVLFPGPVIADSDRERVLVVYTKILARPYRGKQDHVGYSLAIWEHPESAAVRPILRPETQYPTLLFQGDEPDFGAGAVVAGGFLYLYAHVPEGWDSYCIVTRAPLAEALDRNAWRFFAGDDNWTADWKSARRVLGGAPTFSVQWNDYLGKYLAVFTTFPFKGGIAIETADRPEGPWSNRRDIYKGLPPYGDGRNFGAIAHPGFARENGRKQYITYSHPSDFLHDDIRLVEITFR